MVVIILIFSGSFAALAQLPYEKREAPPMEQLPQEQNQRVISYDDRIEEDELPEGIVDSVENNYKDFKISEVFRGSDGSYKVIMEQDNKKVAAYYNPRGEFLKIEEDKDEESVNDDWR